MKSILKPSSFVSALVKPSEFNESSRPIKFTVKTHIEDGWLIYNLLTYELIKLSDKEYQNAYIKHNSDIIKELYDKMFFVPEDFDETSVFNQICNTAKLLNYNKRSMNYTVFTTLDCNARCFYCYENGKKRYPMDMETAKQTVKFIEKNNFGINNIEWFGGEPLYNIEIIDYISEELQKMGISFYSSIVTNAYLFNEETIVKAKEKWNLQSVHTTLDGSEKEYNRIKAYIYKDNKNPFKRVINNLKLALKHDMLVTIRMHVTDSNYNDLNYMLDYLFEEFKGEKNLSIYATFLSDNDLENSNGIYNNFNQISNTIQLTKKIYEHGFFHRVLIKDISSSICKADSKNDYVILPNGKISRCENYVEETELGDIWGKPAIPAILNQWFVVADYYDECKDCPLIPYCRRLEKCHSINQNGCSYKLKEFITLGLSLAMKNEYANYLKKANDLK